MNTTADTDDRVEVSDDGITVTKTFTSDDFPVPAIRFEIESSYDEPVSVRLSETVPDSFPMDGIGFHPEYHSDQWTAYQDHRVEFTGTVDPDEPLVTVYGIRIDDGEAARFLDEPSILDVRPEGDEPADPATGSGEIVDDALIGDIVDADRNQVVKDMLAGESDDVPGLDGSAVDDEEGYGASATEGGDGAGIDLDIGTVDSGSGDTSADESGNGDGDDVPDIDVDFGEEDVLAPDGSDEKPDDEPEIELDIEAAAAKVKERERGTDAGGDASDDEPAEPSTDSGVDDGVDESETEPADGPDAGGSGPADDGEPTGTGSSSAFDEGAFESVGAALATEIREGRIDDDDLAVISSELAVDPTGSERAKLDQLRSRVDDVAAYANALEGFLDENGTAQEILDEFRSDVESLEADLEDVADRVSTVESDVQALDEQLQALDDDVGGIGTDVDDLKEGLDDLETRLGDLTADVTEILEWRDQLGSMFSTK